jgi:ABC-type transport system involved in Fe-S cluster assembly fused permease/ATPase subunit
LGNPAQDDIILHMTTRKQSAAAKKNIQRAAQAAKRKKTIAHLPKKTRAALGKEGAKAARKQRRS